MATPHIAGAMALLWCARPERRHDIAGSRTVLDNAAHFISSTQCGTAGPPNNVYGWGRVDILAAAAPTPPPCNGQLITILDEDFDSVTPPILPAGWTATNAIDPDGILWQTSNSGLPSPPADTSPNSAWVNDPADVSDKYLDSPGVSATGSWFVWLTFRHNFNLEASSEDPNLGFDGGVLDFSIDGGQTFQDITVWGSFVTGGYNRTISSDRSSPIAGRRAWSGNSGGLHHDGSEPARRAFEWRLALADGQ
jgi:hypothetical protein